MQLEFKRIEEANGLLNQLIEHHPHAIFLADHNFIVKYCNKSFLDFTKREKSEIIEHEFCEIMGCVWNGKVIKHSDEFCKICKMRELLSGSNLSELELIHDFSIHNKIVTKHLHIDTHRIVMQGNKYRLIVIEDRTRDH